MEDVDYDSRSALHLAACSNQIKAVDFIVKHHLCFPEATDRYKLMTLKLKLKFRFSVINETW